MLATGPEILLRLVDLLIILGAIGMLFWVASHRRLSSRVPTRGRNLILWGISITVVLHLVEISLSVFSTEPLGFSTSYLVASQMPVWLHWLLSRTALAMISVGALLAIRQRRRVDEAIAASKAKVLAAESQLMQSEARFRNLFETTSNAVYCYTFEPPMRITLPVDAQIRRSRDAVLTECNHVFAESLEREKPADVIGTTMTYLDSTKDEDAHARYFEAFIESGYRLTNYEMIYKSVEGEDRALSISVTGIVQDGLLHRMWGVESNILDVRRTRNALHRRRMFQELLGSVSSRLVMTRYAEADEEIIHSLEQVCAFVGGNGFSLSWVDWEAGVAYNDYSWLKGERDPVRSTVLSDWPYLTDYLVRAESLVINNVDTFAKEGSKTDLTTLRRRGIKSFMFLPLVVAGEVVGSVAVGSDEEYQDWTEQDLSDMRVFADLFASYVLRVRQRRALDEALEGLQSATERLEAENVYLRNEIKLSHDFDEIVGDSEVLKRTLQMVEQVADTMTPVLILGETGTGKELIARALHEHSSRSGRPLVKVNCAALPANLIESELFGYEKGAFTSADSSKRGRFDLADGSTLFLDEIGEIPIELQAKLLRVLQEGEFERLGGGETVRVDVRIIAATNRDLWEAVEQGEFRSDLFYRINTFPIELPALRERGDDIRLLAEHFAQLHAQRLGREIEAISADMMQQLNTYSWPGNVRELEGVIQRALISSTGPVLKLGRSLAARPAAPATVPEVVAPAPDLRSVERDHIIAVLDESGWKISGNKGAAAMLGIPPSTLRSKMKKLAIERPARQQAGS
ncbi:MAG: sigma 54-interacting transcriptional regulator [Woeseiaceae bacterium]|nr:sigma 54-interacting transcriptional regulator [Woeseiaceae bacterium]